MTTETWDLTPIEAALARAVRALVDKCESAAKPHQQRADAERAPARAQIQELARVLADGRGLPVERVLAIRAFPDQTTSQLEVELAPEPEPEPEEGLP